MKLLLIGHSRFAAKRVIPALGALGVTQLDVASRTGSGRVMVPDHMPVRVFDDYEVAISRSDAELAYISTANSDHAAWTERGQEVETSFSVLATYGQGRSMIGYFGFSTGYRNRLDTLGPDATANIDRVFSTPADIANVVEVSQRDERRSITVEPADQVALFLRAVFEAIGTGDHATFSGDLVRDARLMDRLLRAAG